jgi:hypothetical protein
MKLAALGVVTTAIGLALSVPGLIGIGAFWVVMGLVAREYRNRLEERAPAAEPAVETPVPATSRTRLPVDGKSFAVGTALWLAIGIPSVVVGAFGIGIGAEHAGWRWLPIVVGGLALAIGVIGGLMYGLGSAVLATGSGAKADKPATLWIRKVTETGTYVNERPRLEFELHVEPDAGTGLAAYDTTKKATVPFTAMGSLRVGDGFRAKVVGPDEPTAMEIDWSSPVTTGGSTDDVSARLDELDRLHREAKITDEEYQAQRGRILGSL